MMFGSFLIGQAWMEDAPVIAWHRARLLMKEIIRWAGRERLDRLVLHASDEAQTLDEQMGFVPANEMRYEGTFQ
jgi:hypothetical protein